MEHAVSVTEQIKLLPEEIRDQLPVSHHKLLLPLPDDKKISYAKKAHRWGWSKRKLEDKIKENKAKNLDPDAPKRGRPELPGYAKAFKRLSKIVEMVDLEELDSENLFEHFDAGKTSELLDSVEDQLKVLNEVAEKARKRLAALEE